MLWHNTMTQLGVVVVPTFHPRAQEAEARESRKSRLVWSTQWIPGHLRCLQKTTNKTHIFKNPLWPKASRVKRTSYFMVHCLLKSGQVLRQGRILEADAGAEATEEDYLWACSACSHTYAKTTCPGVVLATVSWVLPHQSSIKKILYSLAYRPVLMEALSQLSPAS